MRFRYYISRIFKDMVEAIRGSEQDFTTGHLGRAIFLLSVPMVLEMMMESVFSIVDIFFVSKLGADAVAVVGITESMMTLVYSIAIGLSVGISAIVSRRIGEKQPEKAGKAASQAIILGLLVSVIIAVPGAVYSKNLLELMGLNQGAVELGWRYTAIIFSSNVVIMMLFIINSIFRSAGDAAISMRVLWIANIVNIILDPCLIFGLGPFPELGVTGAAVATSIGRGVAVIIQLYFLFKGNNRFHMMLAYFKPDFKLMRQMLVLSAGGVAQHLIATTSWIGLVRIISIFGSQVLAGYTIAIRIIIFSLLPAWGLSNAASTLTGQNLGANNPRRAERSVWITSLVNMAFLGIMAVIFQWNPGFFVRLFIADPIVVQHGITALRIISYGFVFYALGMVMVQAFNGAGDTATPTFINLFCFWLIEIPLAYLLALQLGLNEKGAYYAIIISESIMTVIGVLMFRSGKWKTKMV